MLTTQIESFTALQPELSVIFPKHWEELALNRDKVPLDPMYEVYFDRDARGECLLITLRELGEICGYFIGFINPGLHYRTCLTCIMDIFYVKPEHRRKGVATSMFHAAKDMAREQGLQEPSHSQSRSDAGEGWVQSLGEQAPARVSDREYYR